MKALGAFDALDPFAWVFANMPQPLGRRLLCMDKLPALARSCLVPNPADELDVAGFCRF